ncbi:MAG TPA: HAD family phosphatase [Nitrospirota bacterium]|jgi:putative hydrolase of the HAD superfamily
MQYSGPEKIKAVFFDLGKVILRFQHENIVDRLLSKAGSPDPEGLFRFLFDFSEGLCNLYDEGRITSRDFHGEIDRRYRTNLTFSEFAALWNGIFTEDAAVSELVARVREKRPVFLLSNINELHWEAVRDAHPVFSGMDGWVLSYKVGAKKPAPAIFKAALAKAAVGPGESVFIDDMEENTRAATECGIHAITFRGPVELAGRLEALGLI